MTHCILQVSVASVCVHYLAKAAKNKGRIQAAVDEVLSG